jgi:hypothetical protein
MHAAGLLKLPKVSESLRQQIAKVPAGSDRETGHLEVAEPWPGHFWFSGWARNPLKQTEADYVALGWQGADDVFHPFTAIPTGQVTPEIGQTYGPLSRKAGFAQEVDISALPREGVTIRAWAIDWDAQQAFPIESAVQVNRPHS